MDEMIAGLVGLKALYAEFVLGDRPWICDDSRVFKNPANSQKFLFDFASLTEPLEILHLTSVPGENWAVDVPVLHGWVWDRMAELKHLVIELPWLYGRQAELSTDFVIGDLHSSLVSLHLIDFWGVDDDDMPYYPRFVVEKDGSLKFLAEVLRDRIASSRPALKAVRITSPSFVDLPSHRRYEEAMEFVKYFKGKFAETGVEFSVSNTREFHGQWHWSGVDWRDS
ncbi:hypothetical protein B0H63DRAFT_463105 [Podospora didyma]|uniref:Uncharacterized protein n=1 Tax=Podospora didyma TaxID=330526 RepID=A0AAE0U3G0_9PEZI|nr:hypothetical protein B0H63DRAFT_463105 [Podospora didyma]